MLRECVGPKAIRTVLEFIVVFRSAKATQLSQSERRQWDSYFWHGPNPDLDSYEVRMSPGPNYSSDDEVVVGGVTAGFNVYVISPS